MRVAPARTCMFFFNDTATTEIYTLSLHDALPISVEDPAFVREVARAYPGQIAVGIDARGPRVATRGWASETARSEEHTSELQSRQYLVCRPLLEKTKDVDRYEHPGADGANA